MEKRGQLFDQPFIMIFAIVVGALVLVWGGKIVYDLTQTSNEVDVKIFISDLQAQIDKQYNYDIGSKQEYTMKLPGGSKLICFYNRDEGTNQNIPNELKEVLKLDEENNIFILPVTAYDKTRYKIVKLKSKEKNPLCLKSGLKYILITEANYVGIK